MKAYLKEYYKRQMYFPESLGLFVNPFYFARKALATAINSLAQDISGRLLDVGCGSKPYQSLFPATVYIGLDIDTSQTRQRGVADFFYDGGRFPFADSSFEAVLCNQVLEHVFNPDEFLGEIYRVLQPQGKLLLTVPFVWDEHEQPYDYARYSSFGLVWLLQKKGFKVLQHHKLGADITVLFQLLNVYFFKIAQNWWLPFKWLCYFLVIPAFNIFGAIAKMIFPKNTDLYLDHAVLAEKIS